MDSCLPAVPTATQYRHHALYRYVLTPNNPPPESANEALELVASLRAGVTFHSSSAETLQRDGWLSGWHRSTADTSVNM